MRRPLSDDEARARRDKIARWVFGVCAVLLFGGYVVADFSGVLPREVSVRWRSGLRFKTPDDLTRYKNFDLYVFMYGMFGHTIYADPGVGHDGRMNTRYVDYWTPENTQSSFRKPSKGAPDQPFREAYWYHKGDFLRISDITFGYTLPASLTRHVGLQRARFYVQLQNPFTITGYPNNDPEGSVNAGRDYANKQVAYSDPLTMRYYMFGVNLTF